MRTDESGPINALAAAGVRATVSEPVLAAQTSKPSEKWGIWQFPAIGRMSGTRLDLAFSQTVDQSTLESASRIRPPGVYISDDLGRSWRPADADHPTARWHVDPRGVCLRRGGDAVYLQAPPAKDYLKTVLPALVGTCDNGYRDVYMVRDPVKMPAGSMDYHLIRRAKGKQEFERISVRLDDPDAGMYCYDPPGASHSVVYGRGQCEQVLELPDKSLLAVFYGYRLGTDRKPYPKFVPWCLRSQDDGLTWSFHSMIARDDASPWAGFTEPRLAVMPDGSLLAVLRTECHKNGPLFRTHSTDGGKTWSAPEKLWPFGVLPQLLTLQNGVTVLSFGRPGVHVLFSADGAGKRWGGVVNVVVESFEGTGVQGEGYGFQKGEEPKGRPKGTRTSGYTGLIETGPDSFLLTYDQFDYPNQEGQPRKSILVRSVKTEVEKAAGSS